MQRKRIGKTSGALLNAYGDAYPNRPDERPDESFLYYDPDDIDCISQEPLGGAQVGYYLNPTDHAYRSISHDSLHMLMEHARGEWIMEPETGTRLASAYHHDGHPRRYNPLEIQALLPYHWCPASLLDEQAHVGPLLARYGKPMPNGDMLAQLYNHLLYLLDSTFDWHVEPTTLLSDRWRAVQAFEQAFMMPMLELRLTPPNSRQKFHVSLAYDENETIEISVIPSGRRLVIPWSALDAEWLRGTRLLTELERLLVPVAPRRIIRGAPDSL
jgi:hypothetical protein